MQAPAGDSEACAARRGRSGGLGGVPCALGAGSRGAGARWRRSVSDRWNLGSTARAKAPKALLGAALAIAFGPVSVGAPTGPAGPACTIVGTRGGDVLRGTPRDDVICGLQGDDAIVGLGGADLILGGRGNDRIDGGRGADELVGGRGADLVTGGPGADVVNGGRGRDFVQGDEGADAVHGGRARDLCVATRDGVSGNDLADGGPAFDAYDADPGDRLRAVETSGPCSGAPPPLPSAPGHGYDA